MERMSVDEILSHLDRMYPDAHCELNHANAYEMARGENCFDVVNGRYISIKSYEKYRSVVLKSRDKKNKRYGDK